MADPPSTPRLAMVVAMDRRRVIGRDGGLPWRLPDDMQRFRAVTMGKPVLMGRRTYESIPDRFRPLPGRHNIVLTRNPDYRAAGATVVRSIAAALAAAAPAAEIIVAGGATLYTALLPRADRLYLTLVDGEFAGEAVFPELDPADWREVFRQEHPADARHAHAFTFLTWDRVG